MGDDYMNGSWPIFRTKHRPRPMFSTSTGAGLEFRDLIALEVMKMIYPKNLTNEQIAEEAYRMADAMLRAREGE